jgi:hypothetical protein
MKRLQLVLLNELAELQKRSDLINIQQNEELHPQVFSVYILSSPDECPASRPVEILPMSAVVLQCHLIDRM